MKMTKFLVFALLAGVIVTGCVTQKKKDEKVSKVGKMLHNVTSKYNAYYNAELLMDKTLATINDNTRDNYTKQLDVFKYISNPDTASIAGDLNTIIEKNTVSITLHRPAHWTDDHYLMLGQAQFLKQDYEEAMLTFEYLVEEFDPEYLEKKEAEADAKAKKYKGKKRKSSKKKKKKVSKPIANSQKKKEEVKPEPIEIEKGKKEKPDPYVLKHRPAHQEGRLWLAKAYLEMEKFGDAEGILYDLYRNPKTFKDIKAEVVTTLAYYEIAKRDAPQEAIQYLEEAIELTRKKSDRSRLSFILAQIYESNDNDEKARALYESVIKSNPAYEMVFNSKLNLILNSHSNGVESDESTIKSLERMTKDFKNIDYHDQLYYAMGQIAFASGDRDRAIEFLKESIATSTNNNVQRAEAYFQLATLYFEESAFVDAKSYFDSTLVDMPITDERYDNVKAYADNLSTIAENISIIVHQDSLLAIAAMSPEEKKKLAKDILKKQREEQILANLASTTASNTTTAGRGARNTLLNNSSFFAYDDKQVKKGARDFRRTWGDRPLEDDWRRSARVSFNIDEEVAIDESGAPVEREISDDELNNVLAEVPSTPEQVSASETKIMNAMFTLGKAFRDKLEDNQSAAETLEKLLERFPDFSKKEEVYYYLYLCHKALNNGTAEKLYYNKLTKEYPESTFAQILLDPDYARKVLEKEIQLKAHYDKAYALFEAGKIKEGCDMVEEAKLLFGADNTLSAKFALLNAMCEGKINGKPAYVKALREVVAQYPDTAEKTKAEEMLKVLLGARADGRAVANVDRGLNNNKVFKTEPDKLHYVIVIFKDQEMSLDEAKLKIAEFNKFHFKEDRLRISNLVLDPEKKTPIIVIRRFVNQEKAMTYYDTTVEKPASFLGKKTDFEMYPVTQFNYREILRKRDLQDYDQFFRDNYLN